MEEEIIALQRQGFSREEAERIYKIQEGTGASARELGIKLDINGNDVSDNIGSNINNGLVFGPSETASAGPTTYPPYLTPGMGAPASAARNVDGELSGTPEAFGSNSKRSTYDRIGGPDNKQTYADVQYDMMIDQGISEDVARKKAYGDEEPSPEKDGNGLRSDFVPLINPGGVDLETSVANIGRFAGQAKGTPGRGLGLVGSIGKATLSAARTGMSAFAAQKQSNIAQEYYRDKAKNEKYTEASQSSDANYSGGYFGEGGLQDLNTNVNGDPTIMIKEFLPNGGVFGGPERTLGGSAISEQTPEEKAAIAETYKKSGGEDMPDTAYLNPTQLAEFRETGKVTGFENIEAPTKVFDSKAYLIVMQRGQQPQRVSKQTFMAHQGIKSEYRLDNSGAPVNAGGTRFTDFTDIRDFEYGGLFKNNRSY